MKAYYARIPNTGWFVRVPRWLYNRWPWVGVVEMLPNAPRISHAWRCRVIRKAVVAWIRWRYGGTVYSLPNPLGFSPFKPRPSLWRRIIYRMRVGLWRIEKAAFNRYGQEIRDEWMKLFLEPNEKTQTEARQ